MKIDEGQKRDWYSVGQIVVLFGKIPVLKNGVAVRKLIAKGELKANKNGHGNGARFFVSHENLSKFLEKW
jgi:hypothetical protein